jgi:16S rRNA (adenine1518-N6/adenine1519-N6)-dimethyltransferase
MPSLLYDPASSHATRAIMRQLGAAPNRTLGQNFLINPKALDRIVATAQVQSTDAVLEIGPGLGALTTRLVASAAQVSAIEKDQQFLNLLGEKLPKLHLIAGDALKVAWDVLQLPETDVKVVANLPYSISKPMLRRLMEEWRPHLQSATLTVQKEVADRIVAPPDTSAYGPMAIMCALHGHAKKVFDIAPGSFLPPPEVTSSVVHIEMRRSPAVILEDEAFFWRVINAAFGQRRKQLGNTLRKVKDDKEQLLAALSACRIDPQRRGETLSLEEFAHLAKELAGV